MGWHTGASFRLFYRHLSSSLSCLSLTLSSFSSYTASLLLAAEGFMNLLVLVLFGGVVGLVGYLADHVDTRGGVFGSMVFGIVGALGGGLIATLLFGSAFSHLEFSSILLAFAGSLFFLIIQHTILSRQERF